jgi:hypothetical protein
VDSTSRHSKRHWLSRLAGLITAVSAIVSSGIYRSVGGLGERAFSLSLYM